MTLDHPRLTVQPEQMTPRAQAYLLATAVITHGPLAYYCAFHGDLFTATSYNTIRSVMPLQVWAVLFVTAAMTCAYAAIRRSEIAARVGLILAASFTGMWAFGFIAAAVAGTISGPTGIIGWLSLVAKDLIVCSNPLRTPLEAVLRRIEKRRLGWRRD